MIVGRRPRGYLLVLVAVCVSMLTISFLRLAADAAHSDDGAELEVSTTVADYAAESGLLAAELKLAGLAGPPPAGLWISGDLDTSKAAYRVEVVRGDNPQEFRLVVKGSAGAEGGKVATSVIESLIAKTGKVWVVRSRKSGS